MVELGRLLSRELHEEGTSITVGFGEAEAKDLGGPLTGWVHGSGEMRCDTWSIISRGRNARLSAGPPHGCTVAHVADTASMQVCKYASSLVLCECSSLFSSHRRSFPARGPALGALEKRGSESWFVG